MKRKWQTRVVVVVVATVLAVGGWQGWKRWGGRGDAPSGPTVTVGRGDLVEVAAASGTIEPHVQVEVKSRAAGAVIELLVQEGQQVKAGDLLVRLDPADMERALREAKTAERRARAELAQSQASLNVSELERKEAEAKSTVAAKGVGMGLTSTEAERIAANAANVAGANVKLRRAQLAASQAAVDVAHLDVEDAERRLSETDIYAPMAGTVLSVAVEKGSIVSSALTNVSGGTTIVTIADLTDLRVIGAIDEAQVSRVAVGQEVAVRVDAFPTRAFSGKVERVAPLGHTLSSVVIFDVEIVVTDTDANLLRSGMSADLEITTGRQENVLLVPLTAVQSRGAQRFVRLASGKEERIDTGPNDGTRIVVLKGLDEGSEILLAPAPPAGTGTAQRSGSPIPIGGGRRPGGR
jgi:HlyD family secretion protein